MAWTIEDILNTEGVAKAAELDYEVFIIMYLRGDGVYVKHRYESVGDKGMVTIPSVESMVMDCRDAGVKDVVFVHNHPKLGGRCKTDPSSEDLAWTYSYKESLAMHGITLHDHVIISPNFTYFSFRGNGLI